MSIHGHTTITNPTGGWSPARPMDRGRRLVLAVSLLAELFMTAAGAFQLGIGVTLLLAVAWRDGLALAGFLVADTTHGANHAVDLDLGGHSSDPWGWPPCRC